MDELKNLVIQSLETNGILGQVRAQLRSCVFKVIDNQDQVENGKSSFHWENPLARQILGTDQSTLCAELVKEFLEYYKLDYSLQIFMPETNLQSKQSENKEELLGKLGMKSHDSSKPLLMLLLESFMNKDNQSASYAAPQKQQEQLFMAPPTAKDFDLRTDLNDISQTKKQTSVPSKQEDRHELNLERANNLLEELSQEEKSGYKAEVMSNKLTNMSAQKDLNKKKSEEELEDQYDDDFDQDDIEEDLPDDQLESVDGMDPFAQANKAMLDKQAITVSQSLGIDPSVNSLELEDYDHVEPVERLQ